MQYQKWKGYMHIDLLWFDAMHYSSLFQYIFSIYYGPHSLNF